MSPTDYVNCAHAALAEAMAKCPMGYVPVIEWRGYRVTAGMAYFRKGTIGLSALVLKTPEAVRDTVLHEYAHLLAVHRHGIKAANHGPHWRQAMADLGQKPEVRHTYEVERNVSRRKVIYVCARCGKLIERTRELPRRRKYIHVNCGGGLRLQKIEARVPAPKEVTVELASFEAPQPVAKPSRPTKPKPPVPEMATLPFD